MVAWVNTVGVDDLDAALAAVEANGGSIAAKEKMEGVGWVAYVRRGVLLLQRTTQGRGRSGHSGN